MLDLLRDFLDAQALIGAILGAVIAGLSALWLARAAERRKAYSEAVSPIHDRLHMHQGRDVPAWPNDAELANLRSLMSRGRFNVLCAALGSAKAQYQAQRRDDPAADWSGIHDSDPAAVAEAIGRVLRALPRR